MHRIRRLAFLLPAALIAAGILAAVAVAVPDRTITLSAASTTASWEGTGATGVTPLGIYQCRAGGVYNCDDTLVDLKDGGTLTASGSTEADWLMNMSVYNANDAGEPDGDPVAEGELGADFSVTAKGLTPGKYIIRIAFRAAANATFKAKATLKPDAAPTTTPPVTPPATQDPPQTTAPAPQTTKPTAPATKPAKKKAAACKAKARKIKNAKKRKKALKRCAKKAKRK